MGKYKSVLKVQLFSSWTVFSVCGSKINISAFHVCLTPGKIKTGRKFSCCSPFLRINNCAGWMWLIWQRAYSTRMQLRTRTSSAANARKHVSIVFFLPEGIFTEEKRQYSVLPSRRNIYRWNSSDCPPPFRFPSKALLHLFIFICHLVLL